MGIEQDRKTLASELAQVVGVSADEIDRAILSINERWPIAKRNMVSTLASVAWMTALLQSLSPGGRHAWLLMTGPDGLTRTARLLRGRIADVCGELAEAQAGPFDVSWDGNWPHSVALLRLRGRIPAAARLGDVLVGSDGGGTRIDIRVVEDKDGC